MSYAGSCYVYVWRARIIEQPYHDIVVNGAWLRRINVIRLTHDGERADYDIGRSVITCSRWFENITQQKIRLVSHIREPRYTISITRRR